MRRNRLFIVSILAALAACGTAARHAGEGQFSPAAVAKANHGVPPYAAADVRFMQGMIGHHGQAVVMAGWAPTHQASGDVRVLAERIGVAQRDEIATMSAWLRERHEAVPDPLPAPDHAGRSMPGMDMPATLMPGMLTPAQMRQLDAARGTKFDRLFLTFMIQHHTGALTMLDRLFASPGGGLEENVFKFASDVSADQSTEIDRMHVMLAAASASSSASSLLPSRSAVASSSLSAAAPSPDPRVGLSAGWWDAGEAAWNLELVSTTRPSAKFTNASTPGDASLRNSDLAFVGSYVFEGNFSGYQVWDIADPRKPVLRTAFVCPGSQSDVSVYRNLLFVSAEATNGRVDCGIQHDTATVSAERARGIRIFDISDIEHPRVLTTVQTCRGSHTNTVVQDPHDSANVYVYVSGSAGVRPAGELAGCSDRLPSEDPTSALFRIEVIQVSLAHPEQAHIVSSPRIFDDLAPVVKHAEPVEDRRPASAGRGGVGAAARRPGAGMGPNQCHDITVYPAIGLAGGACGGYGLLLDIRDPAHPRRISAVADSNFSFWHSATFSNDGKKVLFSDEWGGGSQPRCRTTDKPEWGADAIFTIDGDSMTFRSYYKLPAPQTQQENCVAHNGTLIPIPGREVMVQSWYQGGLSVFDWTDPSHPTEIAYFDRGPMDAGKLVIAGYWSSYWYNGYIVASEISRGLDIFALKPSALVSQNEIDAANSVHFDQLNAQEQPRLVWPASFAVARSYLDQLNRNGGLAADRTAAIAADLASAEGAPVAVRRSSLATLATRIDGDVQGASDAPRVRLLAAAVRDLSRATR
jgi:uncharacterized protein (DUF305 family)